MTERLLIFAGTVLLLALLSILAARRLRAPRLPVQWGIRGEVTRTAPRGVALAFTPLLATAILLLVLVMPGAGAGELLLTGLVFLAGHGLHLLLLLRHEGRGRGSP